MTRCRRAASLLLLAVLAGPAAPPTSHALEIRLAFSGRAAELPDLQAAFTAGARMWEQALADPVEVTINVRFDAELDLFAAAGASVAQQEVTYADLRAALVGAASSPLDAAAAAHLPPGPLLAFRTFGLDGIPAINAGADPINQLLVLSTANARALGLPVDEGEQHEIVLNEFFYDVGTFDLDASDGVDGIDLAGTAAHEIGHVLGFLSGVDAFDLVHARDELPSELAELLPTPEELLEYTILMPLDLFRYSAASAGLIDVTPGAAAFFSVDGGATSLGNFATGAFHGDGVQASHWPGDFELMSGETAFDFVYRLTPLDLAAMDAIGWNLRPVPEPGVGACLLSLAMLAAATNLTRDAAAQAARRRTRPA